MNKSYKIVWSEAAQDWVVTNELAGGKKKTKVSKIAKAWKTALLCGGLIASPYSLAVDWDVADTDPKSATTIFYGSVDLVQGGGKGFAGLKKGDIGYTSMTLSQARDRGLIGEGAEYVDCDSVHLGGKTNVVTYTDAITHNKTTINAYDNNSITAGKLNSTYAYSHDVGAGGQYLDKAIYGVASGGKLDVDVGSSDANWLKNSANRVNLIMKSSDPNKVNSAVFSVDNGGTLNYNAKTLISLGNHKNVNTSVTGDVLISTYAGEVNSKIGHFSINTLDSFKAYNTALIEAVEDGRLDPDDYDGQIALGVTPTISIRQLDVTTPGDPVNASVSATSVAYIKASGSFAQVNLSHDANLQLTESDASLVYVEQGAKLDNSGILSTLRNLSNPGSNVISAASGASVHNASSGVIYVNDDLAAGAVLGETNTQYGSGVGIYAVDASVVNDGVINIAPQGSHSRSVGLILDGSSNARNNGNINLATIDQPVGVRGYEDIGAMVGGNSTLTNAGLIYVGRSAQTSLSDSAKATSIINPGAIAVSVSDHGTFENAAGGMINLGGKTQGATAILASGADAVVDQKGMINLSYNAIGGKPVAQSIAMDVTGGATQVNNSGTINMMGINGVGLNVRAGSHATNSGTIFVTEGVDAATKTANYGIQSQGQGAVATVTGAVKLTGNGAIGVYVKDGGAVDVDGDGVRFMSGVKQTGFLIYGKGSAVSVQNSFQDVSTQDSTLYRIDGGASYGSLGATLTGSGQNSTILLATGKDSSIDATGMNLIASGRDATAVRVEGGAYGKIDATTDIDLTGVGSLAGSVQGASTTIYGDTDTTGASVLDSYATLRTSGGVAAGAMGYKVATGGTLNHHGIVTLTAADSVGVEINGGSMNNDSKITVSGTAVDIIGANSVVNNTGATTAINGTAAYRLSDGASLALSGSGSTNAAGTAHGILLDTGAVGLIVNGATINMAASGFGNGIENKAEISGIQLLNTTLNVGRGAGVRTAASLAQTNSGTINVNGTGTGLLLENADGSASAADYDMSKSQGLVININSADGSGMTTNTSGNIKSGVSIHVNDVAGGSALVVNGGTPRVEQSGNIISASAAQMVDINNGHTTAFSNSGSILSRAANGVVMNIDKQAVDFTNAAGGSLSGAVNLLAGNNTVTLAHGSQAASVFTTGTGDDQFNLQDITANENATLFDVLDGGQGNDALNLNHSVYTLPDSSKIKGIENVYLADRSRFTLDHASLDLTAAGSAWNIDSTSQLIITDDNAMNFASHLAGTGLVTVDLGSDANAFAFTANNATDRFTGKVELTHSQFVLDGTTTQNNQALSDATLGLGNASITVVSKGLQQIGSLSFDGGMMNVDTDTLGRSRSEAFLMTSNDLNIGGRGVVKVLTNDVMNARALPPDTLALTMQDDANPILKLAGSLGTVSGYGSNLDLLKADGTTMSDPTYSDVIQKGQVAANATFDFGLTSGASDDGLYINYGLKKLNLVTSGADALVINANGASGASADLAARVTGGGDLTIAAGSGHTVSLSNMRNDYTGVTFVHSGTLRAESDNILGNTSELRQAGDARVDLNGYSQTAGRFNTDAGAVTDFNGGSLTTLNGGTVSGTLTGAGELIVNNGILTVSTANTGMTASTTLRQGAEVAINETSGIGSGDIFNSGLLSLNGAQGVMANNITGSGDLHKNGAGLVALTRASAQYTGHTDITGGGLQLGDRATNVLLASDTVNVAQGAAFGGFGGTAGDVNNAGAFSLGDLSSPLTGDPQTFMVGNNLTNSGFITLSQPGTSTAGNILQVKGDYTGNGGTLRLNTQLGDDNSLTDKMVIEGSTRGTTTVSVSNAGGHGATVINGIEIISVGGSSDGEFTKQGRIVAGAYDYDLVKKGGNWYLTNNGEVPDNADNAAGGDTPFSGGDAADNAASLQPAANIRPEAKAYASNLAAANNMFSMTLHDRLGETHYVDPFTGEEKVTSLWLRQVGGHQRSHDDSGQNNTQANRYVAQLGGDIAQWSRSGEDRYHFGVMGGYASQHSNTRNHHTGYSADGSVHGYSAGIYGTWFENNDEKTGGYVDSWALYNRFDNGVSTKDVGSESYRSGGVTASVESGYTWKTGEKNDHESYYLQPQAQLTWMGVKADDHQEANGTHVQSTGDGNLQLRLGMRAFIKSMDAKSQDGKDRVFEPFVEVNWLHNTHDFGASLDGVNVKEAGARNVGELKTGVEAKLNDTVNLWVDVAQQIGDEGYSDTRAIVGVKANFK